MEPSLPAPPRHESAPSPANQAGTARIESVPNTQAERAYEGESQPSQSTNQPVARPDSASPAPVNPPQPADRTDPASTTAVADDTDVIEKEWVEKAKKIVSATKSDPHQQEKEVSKLQADYLLKRYGKQIKLAE